MPVEHPPDLSFSPLAIPIRIKASHSLETCQELLLGAQITPPRWAEWLGSSYLKIKLSSVTVGLVKFEAQTKYGRNQITAQGYLQKLDSTTTLISGYTDIPYDIFWVFLIPVIGWLFIAISSYDGTLNSLCVFSIAVSIMGLMIFIYALLMRRTAKKLVSIIEQTLTVHQQTPHFG